MLVQGKVHMLHGGSVHKAKMVQGKVHIVHVGAAHKVEGGARQGAQCTWCMVVQWCKVEGGTEGLERKQDAEAKLGATE